jgi:hypothetical protein
MDSRSKGTFIEEHMLLLVIGLMLLYWFLESAMHVLVFGEASVKRAFFPTELNELWMRGLICAIFLGFGFYARSILRSLKQTRELLDESENKCRSLAGELSRANEKLRQHH